MKRTAFFAIRVAREIFGATLIHHQAFHCGAAIRYLFVFVFGRTMAGIVRWPELEKASSTEDIRSDDHMPETFHDVNSADSIGPHPERPHDALDGVHVQPEADYQMRVRSSLGGVQPDGIHVQAGTARTALATGQMVKGLLIFGHRTPENLKRPIHRWLGIQINEYFIRSGHVPIPC